MISSISVEDWLHQRSWDFSTVGGIKTVYRRWPGVPKNEHNPPPSPSTSLSALAGALERSGLKPGPNPPGFKRLLFLIGSLAVSPAISWTSSTSGIPEIIFPTSYLALFSFVLMATKASRPQSAA